MRRTVSPVQLRIVTLLGKAVGCKNPEDIALGLSRTLPSTTNLHLKYPLSLKGRNFLGGR